jgi:hypothetical protein
MTAAKVWNGTSWELVSGSLTAQVQSTAPSGPAIGQMWLDPSDTPVSGGSDTGWIVVGSGGSAPAFANGWGNFGSIYGNTAFRLKNGVVYLRGLMSLGTASLPAFTLPVGFRPSTRNIWAVHANPVTGPASTGTAHTHTLSNMAARCDVSELGDVVPTQSSGAWQASTGFSVANISFIAEQ